jgi:outer membrane protein
MRLSLFVLAFAGLSCNLMAGEAPVSAHLSIGYRSHPLTIDEAVQLALKQNPSILQQIQQLKAQKGLVYQAQAKLLPQLTANSNYTQTDTALNPASAVSSQSKIDLLGVPATGPNAGALSVTSFGAGQPNNNAIAIPGVSSATGGSANQTWQVTLTASQLIYDGGATIASRRAARINEDQAYYQLRDTIDTIVSTVRTQFYQILLDKALVQVQEESVNLLQSQLEDQKSRYEAGTVPQFNVLQAEGTLENQIPQLIAARNNYRISQLTLARTLGIPADKQYATDNPLPVDGELTFNPMSYDLASALITARANRPFLKAQRSTILASVENITVQAAGYKPTISADVGLEQESNPTTNNLSRTLQGWFLGLQGKVTYDDSVRQVELEVATAVSNLREAAQTVDSAQTGVNVNLEALRLSDERLAAGTGTQLDVLTAQQALTTARSNLVQAEFSYVSAVASYQQATATETKYNDMFDAPLTRPSTLTVDEAAKSARARHDSPLDPGKPATQKAKQISLGPPKGKVETSND